MGRPWLEALECMLRCGVRGHRVYKDPYIIPSGVGSTFISGMHAGYCQGVRYSFYTP